MNKSIKTVLHHTAISMLVMHFGLAQARDPLPISQLQNLEKYNIDSAIDSLNLPDLGSDELSACGAVMCLYSWEDGCNEYLDPYFAIEMFKSFPPVYNPFETLDVREIFLSICRVVDKEMIDDLNTSARGSHKGSGVFDISGTELTYREVLLIEMEYDIDLGE